VDDTVDRRAPALMLAQLAHEIQVWREGGAPTRVPGPLLQAMAAMRARPGHLCHGEAGGSVPRRGTEPLQEAAAQPQPGPA